MKSNSGRVLEFSRLQELDIRRTLLPVSQTSACLLSVANNGAMNSCTPSFNLRSYVALPRSGLSNVRRAFDNVGITPASQDDRSVLSGIIIDEIGFSTHQISFSYDCIH
jgi:hypothetical protein